MLINSETGLRTVNLPVKPSNYIPPILSFLPNQFVNGDWIWNDFYVAKKRLQHFDYRDYPSNTYQYKYEYGESFIPPHGIPLEPSVHNLKYNRPQSFLSHHLTYL